MKKLLPITFLFFSMLIVFNVNGQDIHFSQFYASPLNLNPALTGVSNGSFRAAGIYRNQWNSVTVPYQTLSLSYDMRLLQDKLNNDVLGVGGLLIGDRSGDGDLTMASVMASAAYHKQLANKYYIGLGLQAGYTQKSLQYAQLTFPSQFIGTDFDLSSPNSEPFSGDNVSYFDMQAGFLAQGNFSDKVGAFLGLSAYHLTQPTETFLGNANKISPRLTFHAGSNIQLSEKIYLTPNVIYQSQNKAKEINLGTAVEYHMELGDEKAIAGLGGWYRFKDAGIVSGFFEYKNIRAGVAYDINTSDLNAASSSRGGFEISLIYIGHLISKEKTSGPYMVPCPRM